MTKNQTLDEIEGLERLSDNAKSIVLRAYDMARYDEMGKGKLDEFHLFMSILLQKNSIAVRVLQKIGIDLDKILMDLIKPRALTPGKVEVSDEFNQILIQAFYEASQLRHVYVGSEHLLLAISKLHQLTRFSKLIPESTSYLTIKEAILSTGNYHPGIFSAFPNSTVDSKSALEYFTRDMNLMAKEGRFLPIFGRHDEIERLIHILSRKNKNNPVLIGESGVGKTAIVEGFVQKILAGDVPDALADYQVIQLDLAVILAGAKIRGDVEERLLAVIDELKSDKNKVVFIDEIHMIIGAGTAGSGGGMDIANLLKPYLTSGEIKVIGATTFDEYQKYFEEDNALTRRFQPISVEEISQEDSINLLKFVKKEYENFHRVKISDEALKEAVILSSRYVTDRYLPDKALDVVDETASKIKLSQKGVLQSSALSKELEKIMTEKFVALEKGDFAKAAKLRTKEVEIEEILKQERKKLNRKTKSKTVSVDDVREVVSKMTGIPLQTMSKTDLERLSNLQNSFGEVIVGQPDALKSVSAALKRARVGLMDERRPLASFLFLGPTGVGKTETAKIIARLLFGDEDSLIQVNMSEFMEQHSVSKIIGSPPGYVGYSEGGHITERVRRKPYSVVLFDEIEKAHPDTLNVLLQILEEGEIRDSKGRRVNFRNTIIIMTSNIGADKIAKDQVLGFEIESPKSSSEIEDAYQDMKEKLMVELKNEMRPEFLNRIDEIVIYRGLDSKDAKQITELLLQQLSSRLKQLNIEIKWQERVVDYIVDQGFSEEYGARNLRRKIQEFVETKLSEMILEREFDINSGAKIQIDFENKKLVFKVK